MTSDTINDVTLANMTAKYGMGGGAVTSLIGWLSSSEAVLFIGVVVTILGFIINFIFQIIRDKRLKHKTNLEEELLVREDKRKQALFEEQMKQLKGESNA